jgi:hypothetical protein
LQKHVGNQAERPALLATAINPHHSVGSGAESGAGDIGTYGSLPMLTPGAWEMIRKNPEMLRMNTLTAGQKRFEF